MAAIAAEAEVERDAVVSLTQRKPQDADFVCAQEELSRVQQKFADSLDKERESRIAAK